MSTDSNHGDVSERGEVSAQRLRDAAKVLREESEPLAGGGAWAWRVTGDRQWAVVDNQNGVRVAQSADDDSAAYIAMMQPPVAVALADLLVSMAETLEMGHLRDRATWEMADLLADLILGGMS